MKDITRDILLGIGIIVIVILMLYEIKISPRIPHVEEVVLPAPQVPNVPIILKLNVYGVGGKKIIPDTIIIENDRQEILHNTDTLTLINGRIYQIKIYEDGYWEYLLDYRPVLDIDNSTKKIVNETYGNVLYLMDEATIYMHIKMPLEINFSGCDICFSNWNVRGVNLFIRFYTNWTREELYHKRIKDVRFIRRYNDTFFIEREMFIPELTSRVCLDYISGISPDLVDVNRIDVWVPEVGQYESFTHKPCLQHGWT